MSISERVWPTTPADDTMPLRWTAFLFRLPGASGRARTALWRMLNDFGALKLGQGTWAIPHRDGDQPDLERAFDHIHAAGGEAWAREVGDADTDDLRLQGRLREACEHLWDGFFNDVDRVAYLVATDPMAAADQLTGLRESFSKLLVRDLLITTAARRAEHRLDELSSTVRAATRDPAETRSGLDDHAPGIDGPTRTTPDRRHTLGPTNVVELADDRVRAVMRLSPSATADWERAFDEFERFAYAPDPQRPRLRHNTFTVITTADRLALEQEATRERIARFEAFVSP